MTRATSKPRHLSDSRLVGLKPKLGQVKKACPAPPHSAGVQPPLNGSCPACGCCRTQLVWEPHRESEPGAPLTGPQGEGRGWCEWEGCSHRSLLGSPPPRACGHMQAQAHLGFFPETRDKVGPSSAEKSLGESWGSNLFTLCRAPLERHRLGPASRWGRNAGLRPGH